MPRRAAPAATARPRCRPRRGCSRQVRAESSPHGPAARMDQSGCERGVTRRVHTARERTFGAWVIARGRFECGLPVTA
jgi:hypothetical protein